MEKITITMEEYKELLITKGKYEELKGQQDKRTSCNTLIHPTTTYREVPKESTTTYYGTGI